MFQGRECREGAGLQGQIEVSLSCPAGCIKGAGENTNQYLKREIWARDLG